jgi:hypothetical protein
MAQYWVVGGKITDTHFHEALDENENWIGPFADYEVAKREWARRAGATIAASVDSEIQYRIERIDTDAPPACTD